jgi:hypothetical protein
MPHFVANSLSQDARLVLLAPRTRPKLLSSRPKVIAWFQQHALTADSGRTLLIAFLSPLIASLSSEPN